MQKIGRLASLRKREKRRASYETCKDIKYKKITEHNQKRRMRRVPDIMPVSMQNFLHSRKPDLRAVQIIALES